MPDGIRGQGRNYFQSRFLTTASGAAKIHPATPERWRDLERLFGPQGAYSNCWCMYWRLRRRDYHALTPQKRKGALRTWIRSGAESGLLVYRQGHPVAWCAVAPRNEYAALAASPTLKPVGESADVWSITCYFVAKEHRRTGLMRSLLDAAARHARRKGARVLEGYPVSVTALSGCAGYTGLVPAYKKAGFKVVARPNRSMRVMQKSLR
jgi:GNAT superfamily N-acetyltransferase